MNDNARLLNHEKFEVLTALVHTGTLTAREWSDLRNHLPTCKKCQEAYSQYQILVREGMPLLAAQHSYSSDEAVWQDIPAPTELLSRVRAARGSVFRDVVGLISRPRIVHSLFRLTLAACLALMVGIIAYHMGSRARFEAKELPSYITLDPSNAREKTKKVTGELLSTDSERVAELEREIAQQEQKLITLQGTMRTLTDHANQLALSKSEMGGQLQLILQQRDALSSRLHDAEQSFQTTEVELENVQAERDKAISRAASEESKVDELSAANLDTQRQLRNSEQYLDSDRDIRELMGARNLYIADVFDVDSSSRTRKPFGRVFYTQGKSLIFYAFDLDRQPEVKTANAFQAWGRRESNQAKPLNLGILYMDNESNRRWVLRFDNPGELAEIDAVFVTIEPRGGSPKPTGKPFLYASLRKEVNHP